MNRVVAYELLATELASYRSLGYQQLRDLVGEVSKHNRIAENGIEFQVEVSVRRHGNSSRDILVRGEVAESAWGGPHDSVADEFVVTSPGSAAVH